MGSIATLGWTARNSYSLKLILAFLAFPSASLDNKWNGYGGFRSGEPPDSAYAIASP